MLEFSGFFEVAGVIVGLVTTFFLVVFLVISLVVLLVGGDGGWSSHCFPQTEFRNRLLLIAALALRTEDPASSVKAYRSLLLILGTWGSAHGERKSPFS